MSILDIIIIISILMAGVVDYTVKKRRLASEDAPKRRLPEIVFPDPGQLVEEDGEEEIISVPERPAVEAAPEAMKPAQEAVPQTAPEAGTDSMDGDGTSDGFHVNPKDMILYSAVMEPKFKELQQGK